MRECVILLAIAMAAPAQEASVASRTLVPAGVPLRVALESRVAIHRLGQPVRGRTVDPVYVFDRVALPAGTIVEGHVAKIGGVPVGRRLTAILSGNLTPPREVRAQFDTVVLGDGSRFPLHTSPSRGTAHTSRIAKHTKKGESALRGARERLGEMDRTAILAFKSPGSMSQLKSTLFGMFPYHRQAWSAGTLFDSVLQDPLAGLPQGRLEPQTGDPAAADPAREVCARLLTPVSSKTARRGAPVEAVVTRPVFAADRTLLIPEGSRLHGDVVEARHARFLHRNGRVHFVFRRVELEAGGSQAIRGDVEGVEEAGILRVQREHAEGVAVGSLQREGRAAAVAARGIAFGARQRILLACLRVQENREVAAHGKKTLGHQGLRLRTADFVVRIFSGGNPAEMPFEQPTRFEMAINNKVAHTTGVSVPPPVFVRADEVIE